MNTELYRNPNLVLCEFYKRGRNCTNNEQVPCGEQLKFDDEIICTSKLYYAMDLEKQIKRLKWYLNEIRDEELKSLDIDLDEYETERYSTDYSNIINLVEEALEEKPQEDCRYREEINK